MQAKHAMAQVTSSISDELNQLLSELAEETGIPKQSPAFQPVFEFCKVPSTYGGEE